MMEAQATICGKLATLARKGFCTAGCYELWYEVDGVCQYLRAYDPLGAFRWTRLYDNSTDAKQAYHRLMQQRGADEPGQRTYCLICEGDRTSCPACMYYPAVKMAKCPIQSGCPCHVCCGADVVECRVKPDVWLLKSEEVEVEKADELLREATERIQKALQYRSLDSIGRYRWLRNAVGKARDALAILDTIAEEYAERYGLEVN